MTPGPAPTKPIEGFGANSSFDFAQTRSPADPERMLRRASGFLVKREAKPCGKLHRLQHGGCRCSVFEFNAEYSRERRACRIRALFSKGSPAIAFTSKSPPGCVSDVIDLSFFADYNIIGTYCYISIRRCRDPVT